MRSWIQTAAIAAVLVLDVGLVAAAEPVGRIIAVEGKPQVVRAEGRLIEIKLNDPVHIGDTIKTGSGRAKIMFDDNTLMTVGEGSELKITEYLFNPATEERSSLFDLVTGKVKTLVGKLFSSSNSFRVRTPTAVAGVRGTYFRIDVDTDTDVVVFAGEVDVEDNSGSVISLQGGFSLTVGHSGSGTPQQLTPQALSNLERSLEIRLKNKLDQASGGGIDLANLAQDALDALDTLNNARQDGQKGTGSKNGEDGEDTEGPDLDTFANTPSAGDPLDQLEPVDPKINGQLSLTLTFPEGVVR